MNARNEKALYFCHTHPNLFLQQQCKACKRGMCHTCIHNNKDYCESCAKSLFKSSRQYEHLTEVKQMLIAGIIVFGITSFYTYSAGPPIDTFELFLGFYFGITIMAIYFVLSKTDVFSTITKIPFIGWKLAIILLALTAVTGGPLLYFIYKIFMVGRLAILKPHQ